MKPRAPRSLAFVKPVLAVYAAFMAGYLMLKAADATRLAAAEPLYRHHEMVEIRLSTGDGRLRRRWAARAPRVRVLRAGKPVRTVAGILEVPLERAKRGLWTGRWPCPWNAPDREYALELLTEPGLELGRFKAGTFRIERRRPKPLPPGFSALTWESVRPLASLRVKGPDGAEKDWRGLLDWVQYVGADAFWILGGQTPGLKRGETWVSHNLPMIDEMAAECRRRRIRFGVYAMNYLTMSSSQRVRGYEYALDVEDGEVKHTRAVSLRDPRRPADVAALLKTFSRAGADDLGLDYIRNALGGYELVDEFFAEMPGVRPPPGWDKLDLKEKMTWFIRKKALRKDADFIDAWQWWRAYRVSKIIERIRREVGEEKFLWAFTLTWERGWHHGQDVVMFSDAGIDAAALMLYEATDSQFEWLLRDWRSYLKRSDVQLVVGDVVDLPLHQDSPLGPGALGYRMREAIDRVYSDGPAAGIFIHDLERALKGRLGPYTTKEWMDETRAVIRYFKEKTR